MQFDTYESLLKESTHSQIDQEIEKALNLEPVRIITNEAIQDVLSFEEARFLESEGFSLTKFTEENPLGTYALEDLKLARHLHRSTQIKLRQTPEAIYRLEKTFDSGFSILSQAPSRISQEEIDNHGFFNLPTHTQVVSLNTPNSHFEWTTPILVPAGRHVTQSLTATNQYAQGCFEGMVAMVNNDNQVFTFRPFDNARRLQESAKGLCIPPVSTEFFLEAIKQAIISNKAYLPTAGSDSKLYIRPHIKAITGGSGVGQADSYAFVVEVFPFGNYFANRETELDLVAIKGTRRSTPGGVGHLKYIGNYARTMNHKQMAKTGNVPGFEGIKFNDVFYLGDNIQDSSTQEVLEEDAAGNLIFYTTSNAGTQFFTPSLSRDTILPGFTRQSILQIAKAQGNKVTETHIPFDMLHRFDGAMLVGSAAGAVRIGSMSYNSQRIEFSKDPQNIKVFYDMYDTLYNLRRGNIKEFKDNTTISSWPYKII